MIRPLRSKDDGSIDPSVADPTNGTVRQEDFVFKLVLLGDSGVGKSALWFCYGQDRPINSFNRQESQEKCGPTIGVDFSSKRIVISQYLVKVMLWDTAGQERFSSMSLSYIRGAHGLVFVYDVTRPETFNHVVDWWQRVQDRIDPRLQPLVLVVGNKTDLAHQRQVPLQDAREMFERLHFFYFETSAMTGGGVEDAFNYFVGCIYVQNIRAKCFRLDAAAPNAASVATTTVLLSAPPRPPSPEPLPGVPKASVLVDTQRPLGDELGRFAYLPSSVLAQLAAADYGSVDRGSTVRLGVSEKKRQTQDRRVAEDGDSEDEEEIVEPSCAC